MVTRSIFKDRLNQLLSEKSWSHEPITTEKIMFFCPYLDHHEATAIVTMLRENINLRQKSYRGHAVISRGNEYDRSFDELRKQGNDITLMDIHWISLAIPSVIVKDWFWIWRFGTETGEVWHESLYVPNSKPSEFEVHEIEQTRYKDRAIAYGKKYWGDELRPNNEIDAFRFVIKDPYHLTESDPDHCKVMADLGVFLSMPVEEIFAQPISRQVWDEAISDIVVVSSDYIQYYERISSCTEGLLSRRNCMLCGGSLTIDRCLACKESYWHENSSVNPSIPLPIKVACYLEKLGHQFKIDPRIAWDKAEKGDYE